MLVNACSFCPPPTYQSRVRAGLPAICSDIFTVHTHQDLTESHVIKCNCRKKTVGGNQCGQCVLAMHVFAKTEPGFLLSVVHLAQGTEVFVYCHVSEL